MRLLALVSDAYGARGGIAKFNRDMLGALCRHPDVREVVAVPRLMTDALEALPHGLTHRTEGLSGKAAYARTVLLAVGRGRGFDAVVCGHINLLPLAYTAARLARAPLLLVVHGLDAWAPTRRRITNRLARRVDAFVAVSEFTKRRFESWTALGPDRGYVVPNCVDLSLYGPGPKPSYLVERYGLHERRVITTVARVAASDRYKGHDQVLSVLPDLLDTHPDLSYVIVGDGDDRPRLEARAAWLGVWEQVVFAGHIPESEKADHYRLADAFVMPGRKEGFGIVYLEALACGVPVLASSVDGSREAVLDGVMGRMVDPDDLGAIRDAIADALREGVGAVPAQLEYFSAERFDERWLRVVDAVVGQSPVAADHPSLVAA